MKELYRGRQGEYQRMLDAQVEQRRYMAKVERGMTEYERKINDPAIKAHQKNDLNELPYKLPGIKKIGEDRSD